VLLGGHLAARAAIEQVRTRGARRVVLAVPLAPQESVATMDLVADDFVALQTPRWLLSIGEHYQDFSQTSDDEVTALLRRAAGQTVDRGAGVPA
jgi:predicted phosphoribosyltransferase